MTARLPEENVERDKLLRDAFSYSQDQATPCGSVSLEWLVHLMKERSRTRTFLSSIYFAGAEVDHPYFLKNDRIAVGLATLPEDAEKAGRRKRHPHQHEVIFVLHGTLRLEIEEDGKNIMNVLREGELFVIRKNQCHRISTTENRDATYLFVKTNPAQEPRSQDCL